MRVRLTRRALGDLEEIATSLQAHNPAAALRVAAGLQRALQLLAAHPQAGRMLVGGRRRFALPRYPYLIFYHLDEAAQSVDVITIRHGGRTPEAS